MPNLVILPATEPDDTTYGTAPMHIEAYPEATVHHIRFPKMVWYNETVCKEAIAQIEALGLSEIVLVGFSKSGLGAWHIARAMPERVAGTIIFDSPVVRYQLPPWGTEPFYANDAAWQQDLPLHTIAAFQAAMPPTHSLILISGESFHAEMHLFSQALCKTGLEHIFLPRAKIKHHWNTGWLEEGLAQIRKSGVAPGA